MRDGVFNCYKTIGTDAISSIANLLNKLFDKIKSLLFFLSTTIKSFPAPLIFVKIIFSITRLNLTDEPVASKDIKSFQKLNEGKKMGSYFVIHSFPQKFNYGLKTSDHRCNLLRLFCVVLES